MSGTEFEKAAGREKAKKWKTSVRVAPVNGKPGEMVGDWLQVWTACPASCAAVHNRVSFIAAVSMHSAAPGRCSSCVVGTPSRVSAASTFLHILLH